MAADRAAHHPGRATAGPARKRRVLAAALALALTGCLAETLEPRASLDPASLTVPAAAPRLTGVPGRDGADHRRMVAAFGGAYRAPALQAVLSDITQRLGQAAEGPPRSFRVTLLNTPAVNAFALPDGNLYLTRGLVALANDTSEIGSVIAHEMAHVLARHAEERQERERTATLVTRVRSDVLRDAAGARMSADLGQRSVASFSRQQELEADALSVKLLSAAGYDPYGAVRFLTALDRSMATRAAMLGQANPNAMPDFLATHPTTPERIQLVTAAARQIAAPGLGEAERNRLLFALNGLTFGDGGSGIILRGNGYRDSRLGLAFDAPEGFVLERSGAIVLGVAAGRGEALRFEPLELEAGAPLDRYLGSGIVEGATMDKVEPLALDGIEGLTGRAVTPDWSFRVAVLRVDGRTYRLAFAARDLNEATDQRFLAAFGSLRRLSPEEKRTLRPQRINLVLAREGDTVASLATRMATPGDREAWFRALNGLSQQNEVLPGQRYKLVQD